jgi:hypothetical protein
MIVITVVIQPSPLTFWRLIPGHHPGVLLRGQAGTDASNCTLSDSAQRLDLVFSSFLIQISQQLQGNTDIYVNLSYSAIYDQDNAIKRAGIGISPQSIHTN